MTPFRRVLCGVDLSDHSGEVIRYAAALASLHAGSVTVAFVNEPLLEDAAAVAFDRDTLRRDIADEIRAVIEASLPMGAGWIPPLEVRVETGAPDRELCRLAIEGAYDLVTLGTHGWGGYRKLMFGSTAERLLREVSVPALVVPPTEIQYLRIEREGPRFELGGILVPLDVREDASGQVEAAANLARSLKLPLVLVHVLPPVHRAGPRGQPVEARDRVRRAHAEQSLAGYARQLERAAPVETIVAAGKPADEIAALAAERRLGLIVMGLRGSGRVMGGRPGSIAYRVLALSATPVLGLPHPH